MIEIGFVKHRSTEEMIESNRGYIKEAERRMKLPAAVLEILRAKQQSGEMTPEEQKIWQISLEAKERERDLIERSRAAIALIQEDARAPR